MSIVKVLKHALTEFFKNLLLSKFKTFVGIPVSFTVHIILAYYYITHVLQCMMCLQLLMAIGPKRCHIYM